MGNFTMGDSGAMMGWGGFFLSPVFMIAIAVLVFVIVIKLLSSAGESQTDPMAILQKRFASGDITAEEFEKCKRLLR